MKTKIKKRRKRFFQNLARPQVIIFSLIIACLLFLSGSFTSVRFVRIILFAGGVIFSLLLLFTAGLHFALRVIQEENPLAANKESKLKKFLKKNSMIILLFVELFSATLFSLLHAFYQKEIFGIFFWFCWVIIFPTGIYIVVKRIQRFLHRE